MTESSQELIANLAATGNEPVVEKATSETQTTRSKPGFLDLPPEVRLIIYRDSLCVLTV